MNSLSSSTDHSPVLHLLLAQSLTVDFHSHHSHRKWRQTLDSRQSSGVKGYHKRRSERGRCHLHSKHPSDLSASNCSKHHTDSLFQVTGHLKRGQVLLP